MEMESSHNISKKQKRVPARTSKMKISLPTFFFAMTATAHAVADRREVYSFEKKASLLRGTDSNGWNHHQQNSHGRRAETAFEDIPLVKPPLEDKSNEQSVVSHAVSSTTTQTTSTTTVLRQGYIRVENLAPEYGTCQTAAWVGIHDGTFDTYDRDARISEAMERLAEDGNNLPLIEDFARSLGGLWDGTVGMGPLCPGEVAHLPFSVHIDPSRSYYFSYASMVLPSNDAFIANGNPLAHTVFSHGDFVDVDFSVAGSEVLDAGSEVNDEIPENTAFFGQSEPNAGVDENGVVTLHPGFKRQGNILSDPLFANADFTLHGYEMLKFTVIPSDCSYYDIVVDCDHPEATLDTSTHDAVDVIPLELDGSHYNEVTRRRVTGFCQLNKKNEYVETVNLGAVCGRSVDAVDLVIDGSDSIFIDRVVLYKDDSPIKAWSSNGGAGYCLSQDSEDFRTKDWSGYLGSQIGARCVDQMYFEYDGRISTGHFY